MSIVRLKKSLADLASDKLKTAIVVLAVAVGIVGAGAMLNAKLVLSREIRANYMATNPASFTLWTDRAEEVAELGRDLPGVEDAELRRVTPSRITTASGKRRTLVLHAIEEMSNSRIDRFRLEQGRLPAGPGEISIERDALAIAETQIGGTLMVALPNREARRMQVTGTVHAAGLPPASMERLVYGFVTASSLEYLGDRRGFDQVNAVVSGNRLDVDHIRKTAAELIALCRSNGYRVGKWEIREPGVHPHASQLDSFTFLLEIFGVLALVLSTLLVVNMIASMMAGQIRQIGIMKAIGAGNLQIAGMYYTVVLVLGVAAFILAMPIAYHLGVYFADFAAGKLNFDITRHAVPSWAFAVQAAISLLIPLVAASYPISRGSRITAREAMTDYGTGQTRAGRRFGPGPLERIEILPRPLLLSVRNAFRRKSRLVLTLATLAFGGAVFMLALNVNASMEHTVRRAIGDLSYDVAITLDHRYDAETMIANLEEDPDVTYAEAWSSIDAELVAPDTDESFFVRVKGLPEDSRAFDYPLVRGRMLGPAGRSEILLSHKLARRLPGVDVGDTVRLRLAEREQSFAVAGVVKQIATGIEAYARDRELQRAFPEAGGTSEAYVEIGRFDLAGQTRVFYRIEDSLCQRGFGISGSLNVNVFRQAFLEHLKISVVLLLVMAALIIIIGGIGLMSTMSMNVIDRTREIGVMRAIGASDRAISWIFVGESIVIGLISWVLSALISMPLTYFVADTFGMIFIESSLEIVVSPGGIALWGALAVVISFLAAQYPARRIARRPVREALAYE